MARWIHRTGSPPRFAITLALIGAALLISLAAAADEEKPMTITGPLSEEQFKALHTFKSEAAPPPCGTMIDVAGTRAYLSLPKEGKAPYPGIVVVHEWWGLNEHIQHYSDRLAAEGYAALAVDLYGGEVAATPDSAMAYMKSVDTAAARNVLTAAHGFLASDTRIRAPRRGVIGWCFGGKMALELALAAPDLNAAVIYYGHPVTDPKQLKAIKASVLGIFGNKDGSITPDVVNAFEKALKEAGVKREILRYDADHAFANPSGASYDQKNAAAAWEKVRAFLAKELKKN